MYVLDTVYNDCNKINLWASIAWPAGMSGEPFCVTLQGVLLYSGNELLWRPEVRYSVHGTDQIKISHPKMNPLLYT